MAFAAGGPGALYDHFGFYAPAFCERRAVQLVQPRAGWFLVRRQRANGGFRAALA